MDELSKPHTDRGVDSPTDDITIAGIDSTSPHVFELLPLSFYAVAHVLRSCFCQEANETLRSRIPNTKVLGGSSTVFSLNLTNSDYILEGTKPAPDYTLPPNSDCMVLLYVSDDEHSAHSQKYSSALPASR